jgi:FixJ family two-component response regulator
VPETSGEAMTPTKNTATEVVCLVDDDLAVLKSIGRLLASDGLSVRAFSQPKEFLAYVEANFVPLVILDILMEGMSGLEVQTQLRDLSPRTRVIIMTGRESANTRSTVTDMGACAFFTKPFDDNEFLRAVHSALEAHCRNE